MKFVRLVLTSLVVVACGGHIALAQTTNEYVPGEIIVKLRSKSATLQSQAFIGKAVAEKGMALKGSFAGLNMHHFALKAEHQLKRRLPSSKMIPQLNLPNQIISCTSRAQVPKAVRLR